MEEKENARQLPLTGAETRFKETLASANLSHTDPTRITDDLAYLKDLSSKLKFLYLEQETLNSFLHRILLSPDQTVDRKYVEQLAGHNATAKARLYEAKTDVKQLVKKCEAVADDVIALNSQCELRLSAIDEMAREATRLQEDLAALVDGPDAHGHRTLFQMEKLLGLDNIGLDEALELARGAVAQEATAMDDARTQVASAEEALQRSDERHLRLTELIASIRGQVEQARELLSGAEASPAQIKARKLRETDLVLRKLIQGGVQVDHQNGKFRLLRSDTVVVFDNHLNIVLLEGVSEKAAEAINCAGEDKFWQIVHLLNP